MMRISMTVLAAALIACVASAARAEEMVDNPAYKAWASFKPGTSVTYKQVVEMTVLGETQKHEMIMTRKLAKVEADKLTLEGTLKISMGGVEREMPNKSEIPAKIEKSKADLAVVGKGGGDTVKVKSSKDGKETLEVKGKKVETLTKEMETEMTAEEGGEKVQSKMKLWTSEKIPGGMVKMTNQVDKPMKQEMSMTLTDYEIK